MRIALIGADGVGKSTLSSYFKKELKFIRYKDENYKKLFLGNQQYVYHSNLAMLDFIAQAGLQNVVLDRCIWDEYVYGTAMDRTVDLPMIRRMDQIMADMDFLIVIMYKSNHVIQDDLVNQSHLKKIERSYSDVYDWTKCRVMYLNAESEDCFDQSLQILGKARVPQKEIVS